MFHSRDGLEALRDSAIAPGQRVEISDVKLRVRHLIQLKRAAERGGSSVRDTFSRVRAVNVTASPFTKGLLAALGAEFYNPSRDTPYGLPDQLYPAHELFQGLEGHFRDTLAAEFNRFHRAHANSNSKALPLLQAQHDQRIRDALAAHLTAGDKAGDGPIVAIMGASAIDRNTPAYTELARLAFELRCAGYRIMTGGASGAMDAALVGASFAEYGPEAGRAMLEEALAYFAQLPPKQAERPKTTDADRPRGKSDQEWAEIIEDRVNDWYEPWRELQRRYPSQSVDYGVIGVPVQEYAAQQPTSPFAGFIAMCTGSNDPREGMLLDKHQPIPKKIVFYNGAGGTVFESGAVAFQQYYDDNPVTAVYYSPEGFWEEQLPSVPAAAQELMANSQHSDKDLTRQARSRDEVLEIFNSQHTQEERAGWKPQRSPRQPPTTSQPKNVVVNLLGRLRDQRPTTAKSKIS